MYLPLPLPFVRQKQFVVIFTSLECVSTRLLLTIDNKYDSVIQLKVKLREILALNDVSNEDLVITQVVNQYQVSRVFEDYEDILSINETNSEINVFQLNQIESNQLNSIESKACIICKFISNYEKAILILRLCCKGLDEKPVTQLLIHSRNCLNGCICETCLEAAIRHYNNDFICDSFPCPTCGSEVSKQCFTHCQPLTQRSVS
jgi:hypothetical protein